MLGLTLHPVAYLSNTVNSSTHTLGDAMRFDTRTDLGSTLAYVTREVLASDQS